MSFLSIWCKKKNEQLLELVSNYFYLNEEVQSPFGYKGFLLQSVLSEQKQ